MTDDERKNSIEPQPVAEVAEEKLGSTGEFPRGKIAPDDQGEISFRVGSDVENDVVRVEFGQPVAWLAMPPKNALKLARKLTGHAERIQTAKRNRGKR